MKTREHSFSIEAFPPKWYRRKWKAIAVRQLLKEGPVVLSYRGGVSFAAKGDTKAEAVEAVKKKIDDFGKSVNDKETKRRVPEYYKITTL